MKKFFTFLLVLTCSYMSFAQFSEDFEGDISSWDLDPVWLQGTSSELSSQYFPIPENTKFICVNDDAVGQGVASNGMAVSPTITVPNSPNATLTFDYFFVNLDEAGADETAKVYISTDGGSNFEEIIDLGAISDLSNPLFEASAFSLADYADQDIVIAFEYTDGDGWNYGFCVDNVLVSAPLSDNITLNSASINSFSELNTDNDITFAVFNSGANAITSFTMEWTDGVSTYSEDVTGVNIAPFTGNTYVHSVPANYSTTGLRYIDCSITSVNGLDDTDNSDNELNLSIGVLDEFGQKKVLFEEGTGTWCPFCPRGAVVMDYMSETYPNEFVGVAVHVGDIMQIGAYNPITALFPGYPGAVVDRAITQASVTQPLFDDYMAERIAVRPAADVSGTAVVQNSEISIDVTSKFYIDLDNGANMRVLVILTEDGVTGTTSDYDQANAWANNSNGPMGGYENLPNPVPASQMVYDHVARAIPTSYDGIEGSIPNNITKGEEYTYSLTYQVPASFNAENMHAVVAIVDTRTDELINVNSTPVVLSSTNELANKVDMKVFPNPTVSDLTVTFEAEGDYQVFITNIAGKVVAQQNFNGISGKQEANFEVSNLAAGSYVLTVAGENQSSSKTVIIK